DRGFRAFKCTATVSESIVTTTAVEGVAFETTSNWDLHNCIITQSVGVGVRIDSSTGSFKFNTLALNGDFLNNPGNNLAGGANCTAAATLDSSIITSNTHSPSNTGTQFAGTCTLTNVVTGTDSSNSGGKLPGTPVFCSAVAPVNLLLKVDTITDANTNRSCCIDKVPANGITVDVESEGRPKGPSADVGADE